jgi:hypothetical protein
LAGIAVKRIVDWRGYQDYEFQIDGNSRITHCRLARIAGKKYRLAGIAG